MDRRRGFILTVLSAVIFGTMPFFAREIYGAGGNPTTLCVHRFLFSIPFLFAIARWGSRAELRISRRQLGQIFLLSLGLAGTPLLLFQSYQYISSGMATTLHFIYPVLVLLGCAVLFRERITPLQGICCLMCLVGIVCFYTPGETGSAAGILLAFASGITYAFYVIYYARSGLSALDPYLLCMYLSIFSALESLTVALLTGSLTFDLPAGAWALSIAFSFFVAVVATVCFQMGAKHIGPQMVSMVSTFEPLTSVVGGVLLFREQLTGRSLAGIVCILLAVFLLAWKGQPAGQKEGERAPAERKG